MHTHRLFAGVGSRSGRGVFHTYRHYRCGRWEVFKSVVWHRQVQISVISRTKKMFVRRPACRVPVWHANLLRVKTPIYLHCIRLWSRTRLRFCRCVCKRPKGLWPPDEEYGDRQTDTSRSTVTFLLACRSFYAIY